MSQASTYPPSPIGVLIREWRQRRHLSQLACALSAEISQRHLSFIESGRASPSQAMVLQLAETLQVPLRDRNAMLLAAGYAPFYPERALDDEALAPARAAIEAVLRGHEPYPAIAVDRYWNLISGNAAALHLMQIVRDSSLLQTPVNVMRLALAPGGLAPHVVNFAAWRTHVLARLKRQVGASGDAALAALYSELQALPSSAEIAGEETEYGAIAIPVKIRTARGILSLISTVTVFGAPTDITLSELALECFFPADPATAALLRDH